MKLAVMQPYFFPYLGHFDLVNQADEWIAFDTAQYMRHHWINRNRILHPVSGWQYINVPLKKHHRDTPINQVEIATDQDWQQKILRQLQHYRHKAPYYNQVIDFLHECFIETTSNLSETNVLTLQKTCKRLGLTTPIRIFSQMNLPLEGAVEAAGDWALQISKAAGAKEYINAAGGAALFDREQFTAENITLTIQSFSHMRYACGKYMFEPGLSIIDVMMWNSCQEIKHYLDTFRRHAGGQAEGM